MKFTKSLLALAVCSSLAGHIFAADLSITEDKKEAAKPAAEQNKKLPGFAVHFVGDGIFLEKAKQLAKQKKLEKLVTFHGRQPVERMPEYYKLADVCLVTLKPGSIISKTIPSKVQGYMSAGIPILGALDGYGREVINESGAGICVSAGDTEHFSAHMKDFILNYAKYKDCSVRARSYFKKHFTKRMVVDGVENKLQELVEQNGGK